MRILFKQNINDGVKAGMHLDIVPNTVNWIVGANGSGKTIMLSSLAYALQRPLFGEKENWMVRPPDHLMGKFAFEGFDDVSKVYHNTAKHRQSQWVDVTMAFDSAAGALSLHSSEGMNQQHELMRLKDHFPDPDILYLFDEIDQSLDIRAKMIFFDHILPNIRGTVVVCTHDCYFTIGQQVYVMSEGRYCNFTDYYQSISLIPKRKKST